jgi:hypothetical protein
MLHSRHLLIGTVVVAFGLAPAGCGGGSSKDKSAGTKSDQTSTDKAAASSSGDAQRKDAEAKSSARTLVTGVETCYTDSQSYDSCKTTDQLAAVGPLTGVSLGSGPGQTEVSAAGSATFTVTAHSRSGSTFTVAKGADGQLTRSCDAQAEGGGCAGGSW